MQKIIFLSVMIWKIAVAITWSMPENISPLSSTDPEVAINDLGSGIAAWVNIDYPYATIQGALYHHNSWGPSCILSEPSDNVFNPQVSIDNSGHVIVTWVVFQNQLHSIQAILYSNNTWSLPKTLTSPEENISSYHLVFNTTGDTIIVWTQTSDDTIQARRFHHGAWQNQIRISNVYNDQCHPLASSTPEIALHRNGDAVAVWISRDLVTDEASITASYFSNINQTWGAPELITPCAQQLEPPKIVFNSPQQAIALWTYHGEHDEVYAAHRINSRWNTPVLLSSLGHDAVESTLAMNEQGQAMVIWYEPGTPSRVMANTYLSNRWGPPQPVPLEAGGLTPPLHLMLDRHMTAVLFAETTDTETSASTLQMIEYSHNTWDTPIVIAKTEHRSFLSNMHTNTQSAIIVWTNDDKDNLAIQSSSVSK